MKTKQGVVYSNRYVIAALGLLFSINANATLVTIDTFLNPLNPPGDNQGWWNSEYMNIQPTNDNYITGFLQDDNSEYRSYFSFDLGGLLGTVTSAFLEVRRYEQSDDITLGLFDVSTPADELALRLLVRPDIFADLGTGTSYGQFDILVGDEFDILSFELNASALADINAVLGSGYFSVGAAALGIGSGTIFSYSNNEPGLDGLGYTQRLVLNVETESQIPEPGTLAVFGLGLAGIGILRKRKLVL